MDVRFPNPTLTASRAATGRVKRLSLLVVVVWLLALGVNAEVSYERSVELRPLRLSYSNLAGALNRLHILVGVTNGSGGQRYVDEELRLEGRQEVFRTEGTLTEAEIGKAPQVAYSVRFRYFAPKAAVATVDILLLDFTRTVVAGGSSQEHVDAVVGAIVSDLEQHSTRFGGAGFRAFLYFVLVVVVGGPIAFWAREKKGWPVIVNPVWSLLLLVPLLAPWRFWFPGVVVRVTPQSWVARYAGEVGIVVTILVGVICMCQTYRLSKRKPRRVRSSKAG